MRFYPKVPILLTALFLSLMLVGCSVTTDSGEDKDKQKKEQKEDKKKADKNESAKDDDQSEKEDEEKERAVPVEVAEVKLGTVYASYQSTATLDTELSTDVVAKTEGIVLKINFEEGDRVKQGQVLVELDRSKLELDAKKAGILLKKLASELKRAKELHSKKLGSSESYERARFDYEQQKVALESIELELSYTRVKAPISGIVTERMIRDGNLVKRYDPVFHIENFETLQAILYVPERQLSVLKPGLAVQLTADATGEQQYTGSIERISPVIDKSTGTFKVTVKLPNEGGLLRPGMFARFHLIYDQHKDVPLIPLDAVLTEDGEQTVFRVKDNLVELITIETAFKNSQFIEVVNGLVLGDQVVTLGKSALRDGSKISIIEQGK